MGQALGGMTGSGSTQQNQVAQGAAAGAAAGGSDLPAVMTPSEAAAALRVSEEDVIAAIEAGDLKARKLGNAYRISKKALEDFLEG